MSAGGEVEEQVLDLLFQRIAEGVALRATACRAGGSLQGQLAQQNAIEQAEAAQPDSQTSKDNHPAPPSVQNPRCPICDKQQGASAFSKHLERCLGKGRYASRTPKATHSQGNNNNNAQTNASANVQQKRGNEQFTPRKKGMQPGNVPNFTANVGIAQGSNPNTAAWDPSASSGKKKGKNSSKDGSGSGLNTRQMYELRKELARTVSTHQLREHLHGLAYHPTIERVSAEMGRIHTAAAQYGSGPVAHVKAVRECLCGVESKRETTKGRLCSNQPNCPTHTQHQQREFWNAVFAKLSPQEQQQLDKRKRGEDVLANEDVGATAYRTSDGAVKEPFAKMLEQPIEQQRKQEQPLVQAQQAQQISQQPALESQGMHDGQTEEGCPHNEQKQQQKVKEEEDDEEEDDDMLLDSNPPEAAGAGAFLL